MGERPEEEHLLAVVVDPTKAKSQQQEYEEFKTKITTETITETDLMKFTRFLDYIDSTWYGWDALHYAAHSANPQNLQLICSHLSGDKINSLTILSENALHILLQHNKLTKTYNLTCKNGQELKVFQVINPEYKDMIDCVRILIEAKININHNNFWNETPLVISIKRHYLEITRLLLEQPEIDLYYYRDSITGKTPRELLKGRTDVQIPASLVMKTPRDILFQLLKSGDEDGFVKYNGGKISEFLKDSDLDGDNNQNSSCTLLQYCFRRGLIFWLQDCKNFNDEFYVRSPDITTNRMVDIFCRKGMARCIQHLLENKANLDCRLKRFEQEKSLLEVAIIKGYFPVVALILEHKDQLENVPKICDSLIELVRSDINYINLNNTISVVLTKLHEILKCRNLDEILGKLSEVLQHSKKISKENQLLLLKFPSSLTWRIDQKSLLVDLDPEILQAHLAECVENNGKDIEINIASFVCNKSVLPTLEIFQFSCSLRYFLNHPIFKILVMRHWEKLRFQKSWCRWKYFYVNFWFHVIFYLLLNIYVVVKFNGLGGWFLEILRWFGVIFLVVFIGKEIVQVIADCSLYKKQYSNYIEVPFLFFTMFVYASSETWVDSFDVLAILFSNLVLLFLLVNIPSYTKYIIILRTIRSYLRYWFFYCVQFLAFAICFYILFSKTDQIWYQDIPNMIFNSIILFTGNLDYMETPWKQENSTMLMFHDFPYKELFSKIIFFYFVIFMAIILQNLLLGLLVIDIENIQKETELSKQIKRASFVNRLDKFFQNRHVKFLNFIFDYESLKFENKLFLDEQDLKVLTKEEIVLLEFTKSIERPNVLRKLNNYIRKKMSESNYCEVKNERNELLEKLEIIENVTVGDQPQIKKSVKTIYCKICEEEVFRCDYQNHKLTTKHKEAQEKIQNEQKECSICKEMFRRVDWGIHKQTERHKLAYQQQVKEKRKVQLQTCLKKSNLIKIYEFRAGLLENAQYITVLATYLAVRHALHSSDNFQISINNAEWKDYGDIVLELITPKTTTINAIRCKKIETKRNYTTLVLSSDSANLGLKDQYKIIKKLKNKNQCNNINFKLLTAASLIFDQNRKFTFNDKAFEFWTKFDDEEFWEKENLQFWNQIELETFQKTQQALKISSGIKENREILEFFEQIDGETFTQMKRNFLNWNKTNQQLKENLDLWRLFTEKKCKQWMEIINFWHRFDNTKIQNDFPNFPEFKKVFDFWFKNKELFRDFLRKINKYDNWQKLEEEKEFWKDKEVEIKQFSSKKKDLFNTTDDYEDLCTFRVSKKDNSIINSILDNFSMYINQKTTPELQAAITNLITEKFTYSKHFTANLTEYIKKEFKTLNKLKKERHIKLTKTDILLKITELLLQEYMFHPTTIIQKNEMKLWTKILNKFDITIVKPESDVLEKLYSGINSILDKTIKYRLDSSNNLKVDVDQIQDENLKTLFFAQDGSLKFVYLALWKFGLIPLILKAQTEKEMELILTVVRFLKSENISVRFIVICDFPVSGFLQDSVKLFQSLQDVKLIKQELLDDVLEQEIKILEKKKTLKDLYNFNEYFLMKLTPNSLLHIILEDYFFIDSVINLTKDIVEDTVVLDGDTMKVIDSYFSKNEESKNKELSYLINVNGSPINITVLPTL